MLSGIAGVVDLEFANDGGIGAGENVEPDTAGCDRGEDVNLLMADGSGGDDGLPGSSSPDIDGVFLDALAGVEPLHDDGAVEGDGAGEGYFESGVMGTGGRGPECVRVAVERGGDFRGDRRMGESKIVGVARAERCRTLQAGRHRCLVKGRGDRGRGRALTARRGLRFHRRW